MRRSEPAGPARTEPFCRGEPEMISPFSFPPRYIQAFDGIANTIYYQDIAMILMLHSYFHTGLVDQLSMEQLIIAPTALEQLVMCAHFDQCTVIHDKDP